MYRNLISVKLSEYIDDKFTLFDIFSSESIDGYQYSRICPINKCVFLLEELDFAIQAILDQSDSPDKIDVDEKTKEIKISKSNNYLQISDILELLQGPIQINGRIIIATTNNIEYLEKNVPALVRDGRLTKIEVGYLDWNSFRELVQFYFNKETSLDEQEIIIPTASITSLAIKYANKENGLKLFEEEFLNINK